MNFGALCNLVAHFNIYLRLFVALIRSRYYIPKFCLFSISKIGFEIYFVKVDMNIKGNLLFCSSITVGVNQPTKGI